MFKKPWFSIIDVTEMRGRSVADIAEEVSRERSISVESMRGSRKTKWVFKARRAAIIRAFKERPDLNSSQVAAYFRCDPSTVRHVWRKAEAQAA